MSVEPAIFSNFILIATGFAAAFLAALWLSLIIWTYRDIKNRSKDRLARILAILVVAVLFLPGILVYFILRPSRTLDEEFQKTLEEEALLQTIEDIPLCPGCSRRVKENWVVCPNCHTLLKKSCENCGQLMDLAWNLCPYCATSVPGVEHTRPIPETTIDEALEQIEPKKETKIETEPENNDLFEEPNIGENTGA